MRQPTSEFRVLSLASSSIFLLSFAAALYAIANSGTSPLLSSLAEYWVPLLFVPATLPLFALFRLPYLQFVRKTHIPFVDGWFIHLAIVLLYAFVLDGTYPLLGTPQ